MPKKTPTAQENNVAAITTVGLIPGVIAIPIKDAPTVLEAARVYHEKDEAKVAATKAGKADRGWVKKLLEKKEVEVIDDLCVSG